MLKKGAEQEFRGVTNPEINIGAGLKLMIGFGILNHVLLGKSPVQFFVTSSIERKYEAFFIIEKAENGLLYMKRQRWFVIGKSNFRIIKYKYLHLRKK